MMNEMLSTSPAGEGTFGGPQMQTLLQRIQVAVRQGKFQRPPVGPIGSVLALEDDKWAVAVEVSCGPSGPS